MSLEMVAIVIGLLLANAFFVGAEFAIISARRSSIEPKAEAGSKSAKTVLWAMEHVSLMLACAQLGITVCSIALGVVAEPAIAYAIEPYIMDLGLPKSSAHVVAVIIALLIVVSLHVVIGEMVPKNAAVSSPDRSAMIFGPPLVFVARIVKPLIFVMNWVANLILKMIGIQPRDEVTAAFTADEVHSIVERSNAEGTLQDEGNLLTGAIEFSDRTAGDVMVRLENLISVSDGSSVDDVEAVLIQSGFSRVPVMRDGRIVGYLHMKDLLFARPAERERPIHPWRIRQIPTVEASAEVEDVLALMRESGTHIANVSEGGEVRGVIFLEDIIEELVGEVRDAIARD